MKAYGIVESYQNYKGSDATLWGVKKTVEQARERLEEAVEELIYGREEKTDEEWREFLDKHYIDENRLSWMYDDGDSCYIFHIDTVEIDF